MADNCLLSVHGFLKTGVETQLFNSQHLKQFVCDQPHFCKIQLPEKLPVILKNTDIDLQKGKIDCSTKSLFSEMLFQRAISSHCVRDLEVFTHKKQSKYVHIRNSQRVNSLFLQHEFTRTIQNVPQLHNIAFKKKSIVTMVLSFLRKTFASA